MTTSGLTPVWLQTDLAYNPMMETHTDVVAKCREREKTFKQGVLEDLLSHYRQEVDHLRQEAKEAEEDMEDKAKTVTNTSDKKSCSQALQNAVRENTKMEGELRKKRVRKMWALKHPRHHQERPFKRQRTDSMSSQQSGETCHTDESIPRCVRPNDTVCIARHRQETPQTKHRRRTHRRERSKEKTRQNKEDKTLLRRRAEHENSVESIHVKPREVDTVSSNKPVELCANETTVSVTSDGTEPDDENAKSITAKTRKYVVNRSRHVLTESVLSVLNKGLTFVPTEPYANRKRLLREFDEFSRKLRMRVHMS